MNELTIKAIVPGNTIGWLETDLPLPKTAMMRLQSYIETAKKNPVSYNPELAGNISKSLELKDKDNWFFQSILIPLIGEYTKSYPEDAHTNINILTDSAPYCLEKFWVNFQKENEFNPIHNHGGIWSFVIWVKIPTDWREQHALPISANSNTPKASDFEFVFMSMLGYISNYNYSLDKTSEGGMVFFPAKLMHTVYPFYNCDKERISISGNIKFNTSENAMRQYRSHEILKGNNEN